MEVLGKLLGSEARVKLMRLFLLNRNKVFDMKEIQKRSLLKVEKIRAELRLLSSVDFIRRRTSGYYFNTNFKFQKEFENLLVGSDSLNIKNVAETFKKVGKVKLLLISGVFIKNPDSRIDLLIVGDKMKKSKIEEGIKKLEAELGTEITYAMFEYNEFIYRLNMYDKLIRDVLDFPHKVIIQVKELSDTVLQKRN